MSDIPQRIHFPVILLRGGVKARCSQRPVSEATLEPGILCIPLNNWRSFKEEEFVCVFVVIVAQPDVFRLKRLREHDSGSEDRSDENKVQQHEAEMRIDDRRREIIHSIIVSAM